jgi:lysophospholipase L1-like esterase
VRHLLPELVALSLYPLLLAQGRRARRITPRMPEAAAPFDGIAGKHHAGTPLSLLTVGESPVAGVGVDTHENAITGQLAHALSSELKRPVAWMARGKNGVTVRDAIDQVLPQVPARQVDIVLVAFGVNDTTAFHSIARWRRDLRELIDAVDARCNPRLILLSGVPPVGRFPALPQPLRWVMGLKASALDRAARELAHALPRTHHVALALDTNDPAMMAADGYHPSRRGCTAWAGLLAAAAKARIDI